MRITETASATETAAIAEELAERVCPGTVITLDGDLGTGKTTFTKGFAKGLGISSMVNSPTFLIVQEYRDGRMPLFHFDAYRIEEPEEMEEIGFRDYVDGGGVCIIEWASRIDELIPEGSIRIRMLRDDDKGADYRRIEIEDDSYEYRDRDI